MSLRIVHLFFILMAILISFLFGFWSIQVYLEQGGRSYFAMGAASMALGILLVVYGVWFLRKLRDGRYM